MKRRIILNIEDTKEAYSLEDRFILNGVDKLNSNALNQVNRFLQKATYLSILLDQTTCLFSGKSIDHYDTIMTDGKWVWSADINYYVENYSIDLPETFLKYILSEKRCEVLSNKKLKLLTHWWFDEMEVRKNDQLISLR